ncbi:MAG TPA: TonB-dependent receptor [Gammaproteobacteria bacterium]|nr:TonB-dependent receptor [Gammaproteobacteria bacterium]HIK69933.1 TonB-dependent receptor [Pseudomonadales bacterium]
MSVKYDLRAGIRLALGLSTGLALVHGGTAIAEDSEDANAMEEVVVTGSRIKRTINTVSQETITITAEDMDIAGDISVADALRTSNLNSLGSYRESSGNSAQSNATIDLRGAGSGRTLTLVNGRRVTGSPSLGGGGTLNLNMIPFSAVDRIEVIADGASAVYGSDAVAGVINIILKKGYDGFRVKARYGDRDRDSGAEESFSILTGASSDRGSVTLAIEYDSRDEIYDADRVFTAARKNDLDGDGFITGYAETEGISFYGYSLFNPTYTGAPFDPNDDSTWYIHPGANCTEENGFQGPMKTDLVFGPDTGFYCGYAYALVSANRASVHRLNTWVSAEYELTDDIDAHVDVLISDLESFGRYAPPAAPGPTIPGDPRNSVGATYGYFRWTDIGTRDNVVNDRLTDINIGLSGDISDGVSFETNVTFSEYHSSSFGRFYLSYAGLEYNISYEIDDFDTFVANMKATTVDDNRQTMIKYFGGLQWDMFEMGGGTAAAYLAAEYFEIDYAALVDAQSEAGLIGGSAGNSAEGYRDVTAFSAEAVFPVTDWLEIDAAVRVDNYSDFGNATSPRIGAAMKVPGYEQIALRASWGQGFRAPDMSDLYGLTSFSASSGKDHWGCEQVGQDPCPSRQFDTYIGSNPNLEAEESESFSLGGDWEFMDNWMAGMTYWNLKLINSIEYTSAQDQLNVDYQSGGNNPAVQRDANGSVLEISAGFQNGVTDFERDGLDFFVKGSVETGFGNFLFAMNASKYLGYDYELTYGTGELGEAAGTLGFPEWRSNGYVSWTMDSWNAALSVDYIGKSEAKVGDEEYDGWHSINASVGYDIGSYGSIEIGASNLTDEDPLLDAGGYMVDEYQYPITGRVVYAEYTLEF